jgi:hypothetical protein
VEFACCLDDDRENGEKRLVRSFVDYRGRACREGVLVFICRIMQGAVLVGGYRA